MLTSPAPNLTRGVHVAIPGALVPVGSSLLQYDQEYFETQCCVFWAARPPSQGSMTRTLLFPTHIDRTLSIAIKRGKRAYQLMPRATAPQLREAAAPERERSFDAMLSACVSNNHNHKHSKMHAAGAPGAHPSLDSPQRIKLERSPKRMHTPQHACLQSHERATHLQKWQIGTLDVGGLLPLASHACYPNLGPLPAICTVGAFVKATSQAPLLRPLLLVHPSISYSQYDLLFLAGEPRTRFPGARKANPQDETNDVFYDCRETATPQKTSRKNGISG